jgi:molybdopterin-biosynthesis enzyme MoeA-like protein
MEASAADSAPALDPTSIPHRLRQHKNDPYHESIICWLSDFDYNQQDGYIHRVHRGTGQWFLTSTEFRCWLDGTNETLFCPGVPGAGKTMLTSLTIDYLWRQYEASPEIGIGFLYCSKWRQRLTSESLMLDLLKQLVQAQTTLCHDVRIMYQSCAAFSRGPSKFDVARAIRAVVNEYSKVYLVVDALDQLDDEVRKCFLNDLFLLQEETGLNILATARIFLGSDASFPNGITRTLEVSASDEDISACVNYARDLPSYVSNDPVLLRQITRQIVSSAKGV